MLRLRRGPLQLDLLPERGGRIAALRCAEQDILVPLADADFDPDCWPKAGAYPLIPFHNRVRNARLSCGSRTAQLPVHPDSKPHALHGMTSRCLWQGHVKAQAEAVMAVEWSACPTWPWAFVAEQRVLLTDNVISLHLSIENRDDVDMPAGLGWHPFFVKPDKLTDNAETIWPISPDLLPTGERRRARLADMRHATRYLSDWTSVRTCIAGIDLEIAARNLPHLVVHSAGGDYCCIEPVSHLAGAPVAETGDSGTGLMKLAPGHRMTASITLSLRLEVAYP